MIDRIIIALALISIVGAGYVIYDVQRDRDAMACRDHWPDAPTPAECAELLRTTKPPKEATL